MPIKIFQAVLVMCLGMVFITRPVFSEPVSGGQADYKLIRGLQARQGSADQLPLQGADRKQMVLALADVASRAALPDQNASGAWKTSDYDALYSLLQKYRDELKALGLKESDLEALLESLKNRETALEKDLAGLHPLDGLKISGRLLTTGDDLMLLGPGAPITLAPGILKFNNGETIRYRQFAQRAELCFNYTRGPLSGLAEMDFVYLFGGYDNNTSGVGFRRLLVEFLAPVTVQTGDLYYRMTPLTFWLNEDKDPYEPEPFASRDQRLRDDMFLKDDNSYFLRGVRVSSDITLFNTVPLDCQALVSVLALSGQPVYPLNSANSLAYFPGYTKYLGAWQARVPVEKLGLELGYQGTKISDATDSNILAWTIMNPRPSLFDPNMNHDRIPGASTEVESGGFNFDFFHKMIHGNAEYAMSWYSDPAEFWKDSPVGTTGYLTGAGAFSYLTGTAWLASAGLDLGWVKLGGDYKVVTANFTSSPAQGRSFNPYNSPLGPFPTENTVFNPSVNYYYNLGGGTLTLPMPPESHLDGTLLAMPVGPITTAPANPKSAIRTLIPYDASVNASSPYGLATPNRQGYALNLAFNFLGGAIRPSADMAVASQLGGDFDIEAQTYNLYRGGAVLDLKPLLNWPVRFIGGYRLENTANSDWVTLNSRLLDGGATASPWKDGSVYLGYRKLDFNGRLPYFDPSPFFAKDPVLLPAGQSYGQREVAQAYEIMGCGFSQKFGEGITLDLVFSRTLFTNFLADSALDPTDQTRAFEADQYYAKYSIQF